MKFSTTVSKDTFKRIKEGKQTYFIGRVWGGGEGNKMELVTEDLQRLTFIIGPEEWLEGRYHIMSVKDIL